MPLKVDLPDAELLKMLSMEDVDKFLSDRGLHLKKPYTSYVDYKNRMTVYVQDSP